MGSSLDTGVRIGLALLVVLALAGCRVRGGRRFEPLACALAGLGGAAAFLNFAGTQHWWSPGFVNRWDQFHLQLGSKYFPELGYDGLYAASLRAQEETAPELPLPRRVRDLEGFQVVPSRTLGREVAEVRRRFTEPRWQEFLGDHRDYLDHTSPPFWGVIREDHGYNSTPAWTFVARLATARLPATPATLAAFGTLDLVLLGLMFAMLFRTFGYRIACASLALLGLGYGWRYLYVGSLLRLDWLAAAAIGICLLRRERFAAAGACFGYATAVRVFPVLLLLGPALLALRGWLAGEGQRWPLRLAAGFAAVLGLAFAAGGATGRDLGAWGEFRDHIGAYRKAWSADLVGMDTLFVSGPRFLLEAGSSASPRRSQRDVRESLEARRGARAAAAAAGLALVGLAMWRESLAGSAVLGLVAIFALAPLASYYWIMALLVPLRGVGPATLCLLLLAAGLYAVELVHPEADRAAWRHALLAWGYAAILLAWLVPDLRKALADARSPRPT